MVQIPKLFALGQETQSSSSRGRFSTLVEMLQSKLTWRLMKFCRTLLVMQWVLLPKKRRMIFLSDCQLVFLVPFPFLEIHLII